MKFNLIIVVLFVLTLLFVSCENEVQPTQASANQTSDDALWLETQSLEKPLTGWQTANEELSERFLAAFAAKDLDGVMRTIRDFGLVKPVVKLKPLGVLKG